MFTSLVFALLLQVPAAPPSEEIEACLVCHGEKDMALTLPSGETLSLHVDRDTFAASVHGRKLTCAECHPDMREIPHPARSFERARDVTVAMYEQCKRCHFANFTKTLDSVHQPALARGDRMGPNCVDCHGSHAIAPPDQPRTHVSETCARCHEGVSTVYARSVHGKAAVSGSADVPVCTDCHRAHDIAGPQQGNWRLKSPELCASCHENEQLMKKYGLSTKVFTTYVADFHGKTASLRSRQRGAVDAPFVALCTDCHGVHDMVKSTDPSSKVIKANLVKTCQSCHPGASENFPASWLSHYEPSLQKAPLVYGVKLFYAAFIPFIIGGLVLQMLLHLWRVVVNR